MKILQVESVETRQQLLDKTYTCELSGWELATIALLIGAKSNGNPENTIRGFCDSFYDQARKELPFIKNLNRKVFEEEFNSGSYFNSESKHILLNN